MERTLFWRMGKDGLFLELRLFMSGTARRWIPHSNRPDTLRPYTTFPGNRQAPVILLHAVDMLVVIMDGPWPVMTGTPYTVIL